MRGIPVSKAQRVSRNDVLALFAAAIMLLVLIRVHASGVFSPTLLDIAVPVGFAVFAWLLKGVDISGALTGGTVAFIFYAFAGWRLFVILLVVFVITLAATKIGTAHKRAVQIRTSYGRSGSQVMANLFVPTVFLLLPDIVVLPHVALGAAIASLAELAADTVSSEIGEAFGRPTYLITTWKLAETGANGGLSLLGTVAGAISALVVAASAFDLLGPRVWLCAIAGVAGMLMDSFLGATLENRGWLNNDAVNLLSTAFAALLYFALLQ
ncbi:MAG: putative rane protein [Acidobacteriaceae bacterium]|nr:putative rane protein [Acidobacteriaceae bacterium]